MTVLNHPQMISEMREWLKELSQKQGERQRELTDLTKESEVVDEKVKCLLKITVDEPNQQHELDEMLKQHGQQQKSFRNEIENLEKEINVNEGLYKKISNRVEMMIKEREEQYTTR
ncbi:hypothetical protein [Bacillus sp. COPE52]|uniref:hypothetical protein n=1 Tax=Bacillus sp. COPE52 TaxID=2233998 RepID=UPI000E103D2F|nr:hypothetical protein [Bacillus sp. COPE52]AXK21443.1 hypothetical protein DPQ31_28615 [Bacillus sp. COPE52]